MEFRHLLCAALLVWVAAANAGEPLTRIAFGSCANENRPQPIWETINELKPQLFIFTGDNVYADTADPAKFAQSYGRLANLPGFAALRRSTAVVGTWDDHDYGKNDGGAEFEGKQAAKDAFMKFFGTPEDSPLRERGGVYDAKIYGPEGRRVQVILLDTRWFRGPIRKMTEEELNAARAESGKKVGPYRPDEDSESTMLGEEQWAWLEDQLRKPAELRLLVSSIQVVALDHGWEKWANLPGERKKLLDLIRDHASNVIILSGDRHSADISVLPPETDGGPFYPIYDVTSSGLNQTGLSDEPNRFRAAGDSVYHEPNFGWIDIDWSREDPTIKLEIRDLEGKVVREVQTTLNGLKPCQL